jgi:Transglycosylase SLT domain
MPSIGTGARLGLRLTLLGLALLVPLLKSAPAAQAALPMVPAESPCAIEAGRFERIYGIPERLLHAIAMVESGRWDDKSRATIAWPWTVTADGNGKYFSSKAEAITEVKRLKAAGVRSIDVGCMQVNLRYHPDAFTSLDDAFDPASNVAYAARFLKGLFGATNHWPTAASYYHSQTPHLAAAYRDHLMKVWNGISSTVAVALAAVAPPKAPSAATAPHITPALQTQYEERRIADAYRQARLSEYQLRRERMAEHRRLTPVRY